MFMIQKGGGIGSDTHREPDVFFVRYCKAPFVILRHNNCIRTLRILCRVGDKIAESGSQSNAANTGKLRTFPVLQTALPAVPSIAGLNIF